MLAWPYFAGVDLACSGTIAVPNTYTLTHTQASRTLVGSSTTRMSDEPFTEVSRLDVVGQGNAGAQWHNKACGHLVGVGSKIGPKQCRPWLLVEHIELRHTLHVLRKSGLFPLPNFLWL